MSVSRAVEALERSDPDAALGALLEAWRARPAPAVAAVIDELSARITQRLPPITTVGKVSAAKAWEQLAERGDPRDLGRLLAVIAAGEMRKVRLELLERWERDPRIATAVTAWLLRPPVDGAYRRLLFVPLAALVRKHHDPRLTKVLRVISAPEERRVTIERIGQPAWKLFVELAGTLTEPPPEPSPEDEALLARVRALLAQPPPATLAPEPLFERVYADPRDHEARAVLADLLLQAGDPRGEFIALQLARAGGGKRTSRERELQDTWGRKWLGALEPALLNGGVLFEGGFVARARYAGGFAGDASAGAPEWATITHLDCSAASQYVTYSHRTLLHPILRSLRHVTGVASADWVEILRGRPLAWETLGLRAHRWSDTAPLRQGPGAALAAVRTLVVAPAYGREIEGLAPDEAAAIVECWPSLERFETSLQPHHIAALASSLRTTPLPSLVVRSTEMTVHVDLKTCVLTLDLDLIAGFMPEWCVEVISGLSQAGMLSRVRLVVPNQTVREGDELTYRKTAQMSLATIRAACGLVPLET